MHGQQNIKKKCSFAHGLLEAYNLAKRIVMAYRPAWFLWLCVSVKKNICDLPELINYEAIRIKYYDCVSVFFP